MTIDGQSKHQIPNTNVGSGGLSARTTRVDNFLEWRAQNQNERLSRLPTAAERAVKADRVDQPSGLELQKVLLCNVQIPLREENVHVAVHALSITSIRKF